MAVKPRADSLPPTGTLTFLFTDIEGSTKLWDARPDEMQTTLARHDALVRKAIVDANGYVFKTVGDAFCAAFAMAQDAVVAALAAQHYIVAEPWPEVTPITVRMAVHTGAVENRDGDYFGPALNRVARLLVTGHGGQSLLSQTTYDLVRDTLPDAVTLHDLGAHQLKDLARPEQVYQLLHPGLRSDFPPIRSLSTHPNNLPRQLTTFIGREREIADIKALAIRAGLMTLTGSGGSGKTRLALQVAAELLEQFPDGVWFVELAALVDPDLVPQSVASVLGVKEAPDKPITQTLAEHLKQKRLLLLLDNCEHLLDACAKLADALVRQCPDMKILATSREALGIAGEQTYRVPSLSLPDRKSAPTPQTLSVYESVQLFIDRALLVRSEFQVTNQNAPALASLCWHLDGIPLAIELAAARVRTLSVEEIDGKLDQRFRLLTGGSRTALPRQQTLRSLIDWSYELLREPEKQLLQRLSVFAGGWNLPAAEQVCAGDGIADCDILDQLTSLADKSLVVSEQKDGHSRYRLLETMRQYSRERLEESGSDLAVRERHRDYFLALAEAANAKLMGADQVAWLQRLDAEHENLRAVLQWSVMEPLSGAGLAMCGALVRFWVTRGHLTEGREWCARALALAGSEEQTLERAKVFGTAGELAYRQSAYPASRALHEESLAISRKLGDRRGIASSLNYLGSVAAAQGDYTSSQALYEESLALWRQLGERKFVARLLYNLACGALGQGDFGAARALFEECLAPMRELGDRGNIAYALGNLGYMAELHGDYPAARALGAESLAIMRELGDREGIANVLHNLGDVAYDLGDYSTAVSLRQESLVIWRELGIRLGTVSSLEELAAVAAALGGVLRSAGIWGATERLRSEIGSPMPAYERSRYDHRVANARAALGDDVAFDRAWQEGRALTLEQAIELALADIAERQ
jgi:predicted ATPase/class 3 adenylate cyclase